MKVNFFIPAILLTAFLTSCKNSNNKSEAESDFSKQELRSPEAQKHEDKDNQQIPVGKFSPPADSTGIPLQTPVVSNPEWDKKIIKIANLKLEIKDFKKYNEYVHNAVREYGGYVAQEDQNLSDEKSETTITIKVPVAQFEPMMNKLPAADSKVMEKKISSEDVTGEVVDTKSRLEAKKQMRLKYMEFLKQSKNMEEVLQVQNEINDIQEQIESAAGRVAFLSNQSAMSTINLTFYQPMNGYRPVDAAPSFLTRLSNAFKTGANWISELIVGLVSIWPLILVASTIYFGWKKLKPAKVVAQKS